MLSTSQFSKKTATGSSIRWPKITVERFGGDPRKWRKFDHGGNATIRDTNMPDSLKLLGLQDVLVDEIRKKMAHVFNNGFTFEAAWTELSNRYGTPGLIMQAHNAHLLQIQPFRAGDFNSLFVLAADFRDAVSSVSEDHLAVFTFSTVVSSLSTKLPTQLQIDWGQHAYKLRPNLPSLKDFDNWIDIAVGAE